LRLPAFRHSSKSACCVIHTARVPDRGGCISTWAGLVNGVILLGAFLYVLRKIFRSNRRSRAGYTKNTVSLDTHMSVLEGMLVWTVGWGLFQVFSFKDATVDLPPPYLANPTQLATTTITTALVHGASEAFQLLILLLLLSESIGANQLQRAGCLASLYGLSVGGLLTVVVLLDPGEYHPDRPAIPRNMNLAMIGIHGCDLVVALWAKRHALRTAPDRVAVQR